MANTYLTSNLIAQEAVARLSVTNSALATAYRGNFGQMFNNNMPYAPGDTVNIRLDNYYTTSRGNSIVAQNILENSVPLTIKPLYSVGIQYTPTDLQRDIVSFGSEILQPAIRQIVAQMNYDIFQDGLTQVNYTIGSNSQSINSFATFAQLKGYMENLAMDLDGAYFSANPNQVTDLMSSSSLQNSYLQDVNREITIKGELGRIAGYTVYSDQSITQFTAGTHAASGNITVTTTVSSGNSLTLSGFTASQTGVVNAGDIFTITGVQTFNSVTQQPGPSTMSFTATSAANSNGSGQATFNIYPSIIASTASQNFYTSTGTIPSGSIINFQGNHFPNFAYTSRGLVACFPPLQPMNCPDSSVANYNGLSLRVSNSADIMQNINLLRIDCQMACAWIPQNAVRFVSAII